MGKTSIAEGTGNILYPIKTKKKWYLIVYPKIRISTKQIFSHPKLKRNSRKKNIDLLLKTPFKNDCETLVKRQFNKINDLMTWLSQYALFRITGTGSCIFSEFNSKKDAIKIFSILPLNVHGFITNGTNISILHKQL